MLTLKSSWWQLCLFNENHLIKQTRTNLVKDLCLLLNKPTESQKIDASYFYLLIIFSTFTYFHMLHEFNSIVIMRSINFNQRPTPLARWSSRATCGNWCRLCQFPLVSPTWLFSESVEMPLSLQSLCPALSSGVSDNVTVRGSFSHLRPLPAARPGRPVPPVVEG